MDHNRGAQLHTLLDMAEEMLLTGSEIYRVEDTIQRMGYALGATNMNVFVITSTIVITMTFEEDDIYTETRRITESSSNNYTKLEQLNNLSRKFCESPMSIEELQKEIDSIKRIKDSNLLFYIGSFLASGSFAIFFGGNIIDGILGGLFGLLIGLAQRKIRWVFPNTVSFNIAISFVAGTLICLIGRLSPNIHEDMIMIGDIMLLIPGVATTVSVRDILVGDTISGCLRLIECLLLAIALAYGFAISIMLVGGMF